MKEALFIGNPVGRVSFFEKTILALDNVDIR